MSIFYGKHYLEGLTESFWVWLPFTTVFTTRNNTDKVLLASLCNFVMCILGKHSARGVHSWLRSKIIWAILKNCLSLSAVLRIVASSKDFLSNMWMEPSSPPGMYFNVLAFFFVLSLAEIKMPSCHLRSEKKIAALLAKES